MTAQLLIKCDGPKCQREIDSTIHTGSWFVLKIGDIFKPEVLRLKQNDRHFCGYYCLREFVKPYIREHPTFVPVRNTFSPGR